MANVVVVGAQWGDEGKGKIVDWLSERADVVAGVRHGILHGLKPRGVVGHDDCACERVDWRERCPD